MEQAHQIRSEAPGIGAYKMFVILKAIFSDIMPGRDRFYKIINKNGLMLKPERRRHTTNYNHNYHKYKNLTKEIENLRKALAYSELRNEALHEVLKIGKEQYGLDLLKKAGAKQ